MFEKRDENNRSDHPDPASDTPDDEGRQATTYRTIFISDIHLGSAGAQCRPLLDFLKYNNSEKLYLVGDIIDGWRLKRKWYWPQLHNDVVQKILRKARHGTEVIYVPGNHDEFARHYLDLSFGGIQIKSSDIHETIDGRKFWVVHGDLFDNVIQHARWLAYLGDFAYTTLLVLNRWLNMYRRLLRRPYWSLSQYLKHKVKSAVSFISAFETVMSKETARRDCDGVICGHIHKAELKWIGHILYANSGDWVESATALVEHHDGTLEILHWSEQGLVMRQGFDQRHDAAVDSEMITP
ncbi:MAG: UDP-2,3-diacylglucosamine diphosphatase [Alphaproteobacteria bacterium]|nr:UDP-2,3-diacylglucosamine diphosphatase [Alphaproteobacteria bacterium]